jgi:hypothetical protein
MITTRSVASVIITGTVFGVLSYMAYTLANQGIPAENRDALIYLLGTLSGAAGTITSFHYGSSAGSRQKDEVIHKMTKGE